MEQRGKLAFKELIFEAVSLPNWNVFNIWLPWAHERQKKLQREVAILLKGVGACP